MRIAVFQTWFPGQPARQPQPARLRLRLPFLDRRLGLPFFLSPGFCCICYFLLSFFVVSHWATANGNRTATGCGCHFSKSGNYVPDLSVVRATLRSVCFGSGVSASVESANPLNEVTEGHLFRASCSRWLDARRGRRP